MNHDRGERGSILSLVVRVSVHRRAASRLIRPLYLKRSAKYGHYWIMSSPNVFRSKIDWWLVLLVVAAPGWPIANDWISRGTAAPPPTFWFTLAIWGSIVVAFIPTRYVIEGRTVAIRCGLTCWEFLAFSVDDVQSVRPTHNPLSAPALSLDRLRVDLGFHGSTLISPKDKAGFLQAIASLNPQLQPLDGSLIRATGS